MMNAKMLWVAAACGLLTTPALAGNKPVSAEEKYAKACQPRAASRINDQQGTMLWGTWSGWTDREQRRADERKSVLVSANLDGLLRGPEGTKSLKLEGGHLSGAKSMVGTIMQGAASDGQPVEVAICGEQRADDDPDLVWYRIQAWNPLAQEWDNPCVPGGDISDPRAFAVNGVWDGTGAHHDVAGKITFACERGVMSKCVRWGYKPWASHEGRSLADAYQACTRMARADYCGDGQTHTKERTMIEYYDSIGLNTRMTRAVQGWDPARASFEAAWSPDGASCLARTRHGEPLDAILKECPNRFKPGTTDLGDGDRCAVERAEPGAQVGMLRNRINGGAH